jgi:hypothetical protein
MDLIELRRRGRELMGINNGESFSGERDRGATGLLPREIFNLKGKVK